MATRKPRRIARLEAILLIATFLRLSGQEPLPDSGTRVRVTAPGLPRSGTEDRGIGWIIGSGSESERWRQVGLEPSPPRVGLVPLGPGRLGVGLTIGL